MGKQEHLNFHLFLILEFISVIKFYLHFISGLRLSFFGEGNPGKKAGTVLEKYFEISEEHEKNYPR